MEGKKLKLTAWGEFVNRYTVMVPWVAWKALRENMQHLMDTDQDWKFYAGELVAGLQALMDDEGQDSLYRIIHLEEEDNASE